MQKNKVKYSLFGIMIVGLIPLLRGEWTLTSLCDGFSLAGVLLLSYGGLCFLRSKTAFDGIFYIGTRIKTLLFPFLVKPNSDDFRYQTHPKNKVTKTDGSALAIGAGYLSFSIVLLLFL